MSLAPLDWLGSLSVLVGRQLPYASAVFTVVALAAHLLRRLSAYLLYGLWALLPLRLLTPVELGWSFSLGELTRSAWSSAADAKTSDPAAATALFERATLQPTAAGLEASGAPVLLWPLVVLALLTLWSLLALWLVLRGAGVRRVARVGLAEALEVGDTECEIEELRRAFGIRRRIRVVSSPRRLSPFTLGTFRPVIFLPRVVLQESELRRAVLAHELAHVARFDDLRGQVLLVLRALWAPFVPLHFAVFRMATEAERICDAAAAHHSGLGATRYSRVLVASLRLRLEPLAGAPGLHPRSKTRRRWKVRLDSLSKDAGNSVIRNGRTWLERAVLLGVASLLLPMAPVAQADEEEAGPPSFTFEYSVKSVPPAEGQVSLANPLPGQPVTSPFGHRKNPFGEGQTRRHDGIDLRADRDSRVLAPADGRVTLATEAESGREGMGTALVIDHGGGVETYYAHLESFEVELGEWVRVGEEIAVPGSTGRSTGRHLHFEVWRGGEKVDPADLVPEWRLE